MSKEERKMISIKRLLSLMFLPLFLASCAGVGSSLYMRSSETLLQPSNDKALVRFMRPSKKAWPINFNVYDGKNIIGQGVAMTQFDYLADPGKHLFMATGENKTFLEADLEAGKTYYVFTWPKIGYWSRARVVFVPINRGSKFWDIVIEYEKTLVKLGPYTGLLEEWAEGKKQEIDRILSHYEKVWKHKHSWPKLNPEDGR